MADFDERHDQAAIVPGGRARPVADFRDEDRQSSWDSYSASSARTFDTLEDLLTRFTLEFKPEYTLKLRNRVGSVVVGADATHIPDSRETHAALLLKPADPSAWWRRLRVGSSGEVALRSRKLRWWVFALDLEGHVNPLTRTTNASFRLGTKWDAARGELRNKRRVALGDATEARVHWSVNYNLPELAGSFGANSRRVSRAVTADVGYAHAEVPKIELVVWPWRGAAQQAQQAAQQIEAGEAAPPEGEAEAPAGEGAGGAVVPAEVAAPSMQDPSLHLPDYLTSAAQLAGAERRRPGPGARSLAALEHHMGALRDSWQGMMAGHGPAP